MKDVLLSGCSTGKLSLLPRKFIKASTRKCRSPACAAPPRSQAPASPDTGDRKKQHQQKLDTIQKHRSSLVEARQLFEEGRLRERSEGFEELRGRVWLPLLMAAVPGTIAACTAWLLHTDPFNHWTWNEDALNAILWISPVIAADFAFLMTDFEPEPGRELLKAYVDNFPNDKAAWEQDRAELLRLGIVEEDVLDQMEVVWGEQGQGRHGNRVSIGREVRVPRKPGGLFQATLTQVQHRDVPLATFASFPVPIAIGTSVLHATAQELLARFTTLGGLAAWITDRLYEAGLEDPSGLIDTRLPVAQVGQILASLGVSNLAVAAALSICLQTLWANRKSRRASSAAGIRVSEAVAQAVQHVDTRSAAEFRAGKRPASSEHVDTHSAAEFRAGKGPASSQHAQQAESQPEVRSSSQPAASSEPHGNSDFAAKVRPEIQRRLQKASEGNKAKTGRGLDAPQPDLLMDLSTHLTACKLADACSWLRFGFEWSLYGFLYFSSSGNLAVTLSANVAHSLALLGPRQIVQKRGKKMVSDQLDIMLEKDDALFSLVEARQRLEAYSEEKLAKEEQQQNAISESHSTS